MDRKNDCQFLGADGSGFCYVAGHAALKTFFQMLDERQKEIGRVLTVDDARTLADRFVTESGTLGNFYQRILRGCASSREEACHHQERQNLFFRLIVQSFAHMFAEPNPPRIDGIRRDMLPSFFVVLKSMLGAERISRDNATCLEIVESLRRRQGDNFDWTSFYREKRACRLFASALETIASRFDEFDRRVEWFVNVMDYRITNAKSGKAAGPAGVHDRFTPRHFVRLSKALFAFVEIDAHRSPGIRTFLNNLDRFEEGLWKGSLRSDANLEIGML